MLEQVKAKVVSFWLRRIFLKWLARRHEHFFRELLWDLALDKKSEEIMIQRYIFEKSFKEIPPVVNIDDRQMYNLHQKVIDRLVYLHV